MDVFFNNAGIEGKVEPLTETTLEAFELVQRITVTDNFLGLKHVLPIMMGNNPTLLLTPHALQGFLVHRM